MRWFLSIVCLLLATGALALAPAHAQQAATQSPAERLFREGREAESRGEYEVALQLFRKSNSLDPGRGKLLNIALCEEKLDRLAAASRHFNMLLPRLAEDDPRILIVRRHLAEVTPRLAHLRIVLASTAPTGTIVMLDDTELAPQLFGAAMVVDPGRHLIEVKSPGSANRRYEVSLGEGSTETIEVRALTPPRAPPPPPSPPINGRRVAGFVVGGIGLAGIVTGAATGVVAFGARAADEDRCSAGGWGCSQEVLDRIDRRKSFAIASAVAFTSGAFGVGVGALLLLTSREPKNASKVAVTFEPNGGRVMFSSSF